MSDHPAIKALEDEIAAVEKAQQPTHDAIAKIEADARAAVAKRQAELREGEAVIARNRAAIDVLNGNVTVASPGRRSGRRTPSGPTASQIDESAILRFVKSNGPVGASEIGRHVGASGNPLSTKLKRMSDDGKLTYRGERRQRVYSAA
jgi:hypothetical protein